MLTEFTTLPLPNKLLIFCMLCMIPAALYGLIAAVYNQMPVWKKVFVRLLKLVKSDRVYTPKLTFSPEFLRWLKSR